MTLQCAYSVWSQSCTNKFTMAIMSADDLSGVSADIKVPKLQHHNGLIACDVLDVYVNLPVPVASKQQFQEHFQFSTHLVQRSSAPRLVRLLSPNSTTRQAVMHMRLASSMCTTCIEQHATRPKRNGNMLSARMPHNMASCITSRICQLRLPVKLAASVVLLMAIPLQGFLRYRALYIQGHTDIADFHARLFARTRAEA